MTGAVQRGPVLAIDLGGTKTAIALVDESGRIAARQKLPAERTLAGTIAQMASLARDAPAIAAGIILPGIYNSATGMAWAPNLWGMDEVPLRATLERQLGVPAAIASDRTGHVLGEQWLGVARGFKDVVFVAVGTGIGVGILSGGRVIDGAHGIAGAAGWMVLHHEWKPEYGRLGCWEAEAAGPAVARRAGMADASSVAAAARAGDARAVATLEDCAESLAMGIANLISLLDPEIVVLGGGLMQAADLLLPRIRAMVPRWAQPVAARLVKIELTALGEDAGLLGAARLAFWSAETQGEINVSEKIPRQDA